MGRIKPLVGLAVIFVLGGCGTAEKRRPVTQPPVTATAPAPEPAPPPSAAPAAQTPAADEAANLIRQVETLYSFGMDDYRAGNFDKAKDKFDHCLSLLLESKLDLNADERLNKEFDKLVENIHGLEVASQENESAPGVHKEVPTPIESFAGLTFPVDPRVKERVQQELQSVHSDLPLVSNDLVDGVMTYFQGRGRGFIQTILKRLGLYQSIFSEALNQEGLPEDLVYLAAGESAFNPFAKSNKQCVGIWQFSVGTGAMYGLKRDRWVDEREDPVKSTHAAARHLKDLYNTFGDWYLAMAAYDSGPMTVKRAIEKTGYADFWMLRKLHALPKETENYVPIFLATALIAKDPKTYGFDVTPDAPLNVDKVPMGEPTDIRLVAELINHPVEELIQLNPSMLRWTTPANDPAFTLNLPAATGKVFTRAIASIPADKRIWWRSHKVDGGESVVSIARKYRISPVALARANGIDSDAALELGARLVLPLASGSDSSLQRVHDRGPTHTVSYRVRSGDTLELIADRFDVTPYQIRQWNHLKSSRVAPGKSLRVYRAGGGGGSSRRSSRKRRTRNHTKSAHAAVAKGKAAHRKKSRASNALLLSKTPRSHSLMAAR